MLVREALSNSMRLLGNNVKRLEDNETVMLE